MENRSIAAYLLGALVLLGAGYAVWTAVISKGTIAVIGDGVAVVGGGTRAPFIVQIDSDPAFICNASPCEFRVKTGAHSVSVHRDGYSDFTKAVSVSMRGRTEVSASLEKVIKAEAMSEKFVVPVVKNPFVLRIDKDSGLHSIVKDDAVIAYFSRAFERPRLLTNTNQSIVWIIDHARPISSIYQVDVVKKTRKLVYETSDAVRAIVPEESGKSVAVVLGNSVDLVTVDASASGTSTFTMTLPVALESEKVFTWKDTGVFFYMDSGLLKRGYLDNPQRHDNIRAWAPAEDAIIGLVNDAASSRLVIIGKKASYEVKY